MIWNDIEQSVTLLKPIVKGSFSQSVDTSVARGPLCAITTNFVLELLLVSSVHNTGDCIFFLGLASMLMYETSRCLREQNDILMTHCERQLTIRDICLSKRIAIIWRCLLEVHALVERYYIVPHGLINCSMHHWGQIIAHTHGTFISCSFENTYIHGFFFTNYNKIIVHLIDELQSAWKYQCNATNMK